MRMPRSTTASRNDIARMPQPRLRVGMLLGEAGGDEVELALRLRRWCSRVGAGAKPAT